MPQINANVFYDYYSQSFHPHAQKQPAKLSADSGHLDFLLMWVKWLIPGSPIL
jgi:hypothetical protein